MAEANMGLWNTLQEKIPGFWRLSALARKMRCDEALGKIKFKWPIYDAWRYFRNREPKRLYRVQKTHMVPKPLEQQVIDDLEENGISVIHFNDLFSHQQLKELQQSGEM